MPVMQLTPILLAMRGFEIFSQIYLLCTILQKNISKKKYLISTTLIVLLYEIYIKVIPYNYNYKLIISFIMVTTVMTITLKLNVYKVVIGYSITTLIIVLLDMFCGVIFYALLGVDEFKEISYSTTYYYLGMILLNICTLIVALTIKYFKMSFTKADNDNKDIGIAFNSLLTLLFIFPSITLIISYIENRPLSISSIIVNLISMLAILTISIFNSQKRYNLILSEQELENQKNYNATLQSLVDSLKTFKHDYNNTLATLYGYVQLNDMNSLKRMFKEILEESKEISSLDKINPNLIKDPNVFGLITSKYQVCVKNNVNMSFEIFAELEEKEIGIKIFDLTRVLGIFLDNAIEAASGSKEKNIHFLITEKDDKIIIEISNSYSDKALSTEKIYEKGVSSKGKNRGLGLYKVKEIIKRNPNVSLETILHDEVFLQRLTIQKI